MFIYFSVFYYFRMVISYVFIDFAGVLFSAEFNEETISGAHSLALDELKASDLSFDMPTLREAYDGVIAQYLEERSQREWTLGEILRKVFSRSNGDITDELLTKLEDIYKLNSGILRPYPATKRVVPKLAEYGKLGIISDCPHDSLVHALRKDDLAGYFTTTTMSWEVGRRKPHPRIYLRALEKSGAEPENALFVYHEQAEGEGARDVGMQTALVEGENLENLLGVIGAYG